MLCGFAHAFPWFVADLLEREAGLSRRFREESFTDMWVAALVPLREHGVFSDMAIEKETGADLELWFLSKQLDRGLGFVIQAKRIECDRCSQPPFKCVKSDWRKHRFPELDHEGGNGRIRGSQARDLVQASRRTGRPVYPLYAFYIPRHICEASNDSVKGVMLADGYSVRRTIVQGLWDSRRRNSMKRRGPAKFKELKMLEDLLIPLEAMFCISPRRTLWEMVEDGEIQAGLLYLHFFTRRYEVMNIPDPSEVAERMEQALRDRPTHGAKSILPAITKDIPPDVISLVRGESITSPIAHKRASSSARRRIAFVATLERQELD